jgi:hypothetical protein
MTPPAIQLTQPFLPFANELIVPPADPAMPPTIAPRIALGITTSRGPAPKPGIQHIVVAPMTAPIDPHRNVQYNTSASKCWTPLALAPGCLSGWRGCSGWLSRLGTSSLMLVHLRRLLWRCIFSHFNDPQAPASTRPLQLCQGLLPVFFVTPVGPSVLLPQQELRQGVGGVTVLVEAAQHELRVQLAAGVAVLLSCGRWRSGRESIPVSAGRAAASR